jgi:hypothetical protein
MYPISNFFTSLRIRRRRRKTRRRRRRRRRQRRRSRRDVAEIVVGSIDACGLSQFA